MKNTSANVGSSLKLETLTQLWPAGALQLSGSKVLVSSRPIWLSLGWLAQSLTEALLKQHPSVNEGKKSRERHQRQK